MEAPSVQNFRSYLRINTAQPRPDYDAALRFLGIVDFGST